MASVNSSFSDLIAIELGTYHGWPTWLLLLSLYVSCRNSPSYARCPCLGRWLSLLLCYVAIDYALDFVFTLLEILLRGSRQFLTGFRRQLGEASMQPQHNVCSVCYRCSLVLVTAFSQHYHSGYWSNKSTVTDDYFRDMSNCPRFVYDILDEVLDQQLRSGRKTVVGFHMWDLDSFEQQFGHRFFDMKQDTGNFIAQEIKSFVEGATSLALESLVFAL